MQKQIMGYSCCSEYFLEWGRSIKTNDIGKHQTQQWLLNEKMAYILNNRMV